MDALGEYWVTLDFLNSEARRLEDATGHYDERVRGVVTSEPSDGSPTAVFQIEAESPEDAYRGAEELYANLRGTAGLAESQALGGTVTTIREPAIEKATPRCPPPLPLYRRLLTACEVASAAAIRQQLAMQSSILLRAVERPIAGRWAMTDKRVVDVWVTLAGDDPRNAAFWADYREQTGRRHRIVHAGGTVSAADAAASVVVAEKVCQYMLDHS
jgi:hypothetical protein